MRHRGAAPLRLVAALAVLITAAPAGAGRAIEYLYMDGSEGGGSGGHAALALGDRVFHFEHRAGILRLAREPVEVIRHRYGVLDNRTILASRIPVSPDTYALVLDELTRRYVVQRQHLADYEAAVNDRRLLEAARDHQVGASEAAAMVLDGAGFFFDEVSFPSAVPAAGDSAEDPAPALLRLRERVKAAHGDDVLERAMRRAHAELSELRPGAEAGAAEPLAVDRLAPVRYGFAERYRDTLLALLALSVLDSARPLRPGSFADAPLPELTPDDVATVERLGDLLEASLVRLVQSRRADRGFPLLLGMARLIALDETRRSARWVVLGANPADAAVIRGERLLGRPAIARGLRDRVEAEFGSAQAALLQRGTAADAFPEVEIAELEAAGNRLGQVEAGRDARPAWGAPLPRRGVRLPARLLPPIARDDLRGAITAAAEREAAQLAGLKRLYGYHLVTRNCVTEIFRTIEAALRRDILAGEPALAGPALAARVRRASVERLGGYVEPAGGMTFIPAVSAAAVRTGYAVSDVVERPSYRRVQIGRMYERENPVWVFLRESNAVTSTLYRKAPEDSAFLFFTDTAPAARPVFGALNVITGLGVAAAGLATLPVDGGELLTSGLKGAFFSLPELAFFNIRKGSFPDVERGR